MMLKADALADGLVLVYEIKCLVNGKLYFGVTRKTLAWRWRQHCKEARASRFDTVFYRAMRKYGPENFSLRIVYEAINGAEAQKVERAMIAQYGTLAPLGMNTSTGGEANAGRRLSPEVKEKMSAAKLGKKMSDAARKNMSIAQTGRRHSPETLQKMREVQAREDVKARRAAGMYTDENVARMKRSASEHLKKLWRDPDFRARRLADLSALIERQKARKAIRLATAIPNRTKHDAMLERWQSKEYREKMLKVYLATSEKRRAAMIVSNIGRKGERRTAQQNAEKSALMKKAWVDPVVRAKRVEACKKCGDTKKYGAPTAGVRALARKLPIDLYPREVA